MTRSQKIPKQFPTARRSPIPFAIGLGLFVAGIMVYSTFMGGRMSLRYAPLADAAMEIKLEAAMGHLWFEEVISGDRNEDIAIALQHIDQSAWYARAMLEGGENQEGVFIPLRDSVLRIEIEEVLMKIKEFREIAEQRWATAEQSGIGSDIDQHFDAVFEDFLEHADNVKTALQGAMAKGLFRFRIVQGLLVILCLGLSALVVHQLQAALAKVKLLSGLIPICTSCKKIRNDKGFWVQVESYISAHSEADVTHGVCPDCIKRLHSDIYKRL